MQSTPIHATDSLDPTAEPITARPMQDDTDLWKIRNLLIETFPITPPLWNWPVRRWDGRRFHDAEPHVANILRGGPIHLWETAEGRLVGAVNHEGGLGEAFIQLHPDYRHLEPEMIAWAEDHLAKISDDGTRTLEFGVMDYDAPRRLRLEERGYARADWGGMVRMMRLDTRVPIPAPQVAEGYVMRPVERTIEDGQRIADLLNAAFKRPGFHQGQDVLSFFNGAPDFDPELDLVAVAPDGSFAAYAGLTLEPTNLFAEFEPICTHPDHQRLGLARALMLEGLHRLRARSTRSVHVGTGDAMAANKLYDAMGFTEAYHLSGWVKRW